MTNGRKELDRFSYTQPNGTYYGGKLSKDCRGDLIRIEDVRPLFEAAVELELYGATVSRLEKLGRALKLIGL